MLASLTDAPLDDPHFVYEPKYDGIRAVAEIGDGVRLWSRLGNDKAAQFPEIARALEGWAKKRKATVVLDGEIVALDEKGEPTGFQEQDLLLQRAAQPLVRVAFESPLVCLERPDPVRFLGIQCA